MKKLILVAVALAFVGCASRTEVTTYGGNVIKLEEGLYVKEYALGENSASSTRYIFVQCDADGTILRGLSSTSIQSRGKSTVSVGTSLILEDK